MRIIESDNAIKLKLYEEIARALNSSITKNREKILLNIRLLAKTVLLSSNTYNSLINGSLNYHFGFPGQTAQEQVNAIIDYVVNKINLIHYRAKSNTTGINSGLQVNLYRGSEQLLSLPSATIKVEELQIPWLQWLLTEGDSIIISGFSIKLEQGVGRSGGGIMIANNAGSWRVPPEYAGTDEDNWLTRTLGSSIFQNGVEKILKDHL